MSTEPSFLAGLIVGFASGAITALAFSVLACLRLVIENRRLRDVDRSGG